MSEHVGHTRDAGWQAGASRTVHLPPTSVWEFLVSSAGTRIWLGHTELPTRPGQRYATTDGTTGEIRTYREVDRIRLTWRPKDRRQPATYQIALRPTSTGCTIVLHLERLSDRAERQAMKAKLAGIADRLRDELA